MAYDNVIIFGAGASADAGIPLLNNFVDTMWNYSIRGRTHRETISDADRQILAEANKIRIDLERYNSRANFKLRNLEDVLSLLSFEALAGGDSLKNYLKWVRAITQTVELSTLHPQNDPNKTPEQNLSYKRTIYHQFWNILLGANTTAQPPALITFNYDLVLERTLWDYFHYLHGDNQRFKPARESCKINYFLKPYDFSIFGVPCRYNIPEPGRPGYVTRHDGFKPAFQYNAQAVVEIPYLKLHGSLNWCAKTTPKQDEPISTELRPAIFPTQVAETPLILPPVFNKLNSGDVASVWRKALEILREAKHIILVGYSLPKTDIYLQYFLKSAVGPNSNLQRIIVYDPTLFSDSSSNEEMRQRYRECFSPQFQEQITFEPMVEHMFPENEKGKLSHFIQTLKNSRNELFFTP